ncbi:MAG: hypothetical protein MR546_10800 [Oscillospiraceae bacterium]|nr:hypothetical protein [Oscillospiraceae bacterium]
MRNTEKTAEQTFESVAEYNIGHTTYIVVTNFDFSGESLEDVIHRLMVREINTAA